MDKAQKEYYLREQLKAIRKELGDGPDADEELEDITKAIEKAGLPADVRKEADKAAQAARHDARRLGGSQRRAHLSRLAGGIAVEKRCPGISDIVRPKTCWTRITTG